jgi:hypothetical protein
VATVERRVPATAPLLALALAACAEWPRFAHLPESGDAHPAGEDVTEADVTWTELGARDDADDDDPRALPAELHESLAVGAGNVLRGRATGSGWDFDAVPERPADCGVPSGFPTEATGDYLGDADWRVVVVTEPGALCSDFAYSDGETSADVLLFPLDACGVPGEPARDEAGLVVGFGDEDARNAWAVEIPEAGTYGVVAAAWSPDDPERALRYLWGLALVPRPLPDKAPRCPTLTEAR